jgi:hypothetical protein
MADNLRELPRWTADREGLERVRRTQIIKASPNGGPCVTSQPALVLK